MEEVIRYTTEEGAVAIEVNLRDETVWLSQAQMEVLFEKSKKTISEHINNVFREGELNEKSVVRKFRTTGFRLVGGGAGERVVIPLDDSEGRLPRFAFFVVQ